MPSFCAHTSSPDFKVSTTEHVLVSNWLPVVVVPWANVTAFCTPFSMTESEAECRGTLVTVKKNEYIPKTGAIKCPLEAL